MQAGAKADGYERRPRALDEMRAGTTKSLNAALLEQLRADLLNGGIDPDVKLKIPDLCQQYGVSPGVAREALSRLVPEGLVDFTDQRGFRTPPITEAGINDINRVRMLIEREALVDSMRNGTDAWESEIIAAQYRLQRCERDEGNANSHESADWTARHKDFHRALISACTSPWLIRLHNLFYDQTERYRFISAKAGNVATGARRNVVDEHAQIVDAVIGRDEEQAVKLMEDHLQRTADRVLATMATQTGDKANGRLRGKAALSTKATAPDI